MTEIIKLGLVIAFLVSIWGFAAFLMYHRVPGWGWFLAAVVLVMFATEINVSSKSASAEVNAVLKQATGGETHGR